jgi:hypothetical protein
VVSYIDLKWQQLRQSTIIVNLDKVVTYHHHINLNTPGKRSQWSETTQMSLSDTKKEWLLLERFCCIQIAISIVVRDGAGAPSSSSQALYQSCSWSYSPSSSYPESYLTINCSETHLWARGEIIGGSEATTVVIL